MDANDILTRLALRHRPSKVEFSADSLEFLNMSYGIGGEDLILRKRLKNKLFSGEPGTYVDVGSFHPFLASNTYIFYGAGWSGICIDANPIFKDAFVQFRPRDIFVHAAVLEQPKDIYFAEHLKNTGMSSIFDDPQKIPDGFGAPVKVGALRLDAILDKYFSADRFIDFMSVDTEGADLSVLKSNDWNRFRPAFLCVEEHGVTIAELDGSPVINYLNEVGYAVFAFAPPNLFFEDTTL